MGEVLKTLKWGARISFSFPFDILEKQPDQYNGKENGGNDPHRRRDTGCDPRKSDSTQIEDQQDPEQRVCKQQQQNRFPKL